MKYKTADLTGKELDAAVAKCIGRGGRYHTRAKRFVRGIDGDMIDVTKIDESSPYPFSSSWEHGGPVLEREGVVCWPASRYIDPPNPKAPDIEVKGWNAMHPDSKGLGGWHMHGSIDATNHDGMFGPTMLVAGLRAVVQAKLGDEVELP